MILRAGIVAARHPLGVGPSANRSRRRSPLSAGQPYLSLVVTFSKFLQDETAFATLRHCVQPEEMFAALKQIRLRRPGPQLAVAQL